MSADVPPAGAARFVVSVVLFSVGGLFALYEGYHKLLAPEPLKRWYWAVGVLLVAIALESFSLRTAVRESAPLKGSRSWLQFVRTAKAPELPVVLLEDFAALTGLVLALLAVVLTEATGNPVWDATGTLAIGVLLVTVAAVLAVGTKSLLLGEAASRADVARICAALEAEPAVGRVIHLRTLHLGPEELLVAAKIAVSGEDRAAAVARTIDRGTHG